MKKPAGQDRTAAERNYAAKATRRRRRILRAGFFFILCNEPKSGFVTLFLYEEKK